MTSSDESVRSLAKAIRREALGMVYRANASHIGGALSSADILAVLYSGVLNVDPRAPSWPGRDRFIMSKGHCCTALYAVLALKGFFHVEELQEYGTDGSRLLSHTSHKVPGVEWSTGSLGHGLPIACGQSLAARRKGESWKVFCLLSDGEMNEGSTWEAVFFAAHHGLENLTAIVDANGQQGMGHTRDILRMENLDERFRTAGWDAEVVDGHDVAALTEAFSVPPSKRPRVIVAKTVKGKGVPFMEDNIEWHYRPPRTPEEFHAALRALEGELS